MISEKKSFLRVQFQLFSMMFFSYFFIFSTSIFFKEESEGQSCKHVGILCQGTAWQYLLLLLLLFDMSLESSQKFVFTFNL